MKPSALSACVAALYAASGLLAQPQPSVAGQLRLGNVRRLYVESLGEGDAAKIVHDQLVGALLNRTPFKVERDQSRADGRLIGTAVVKSGVAQWIVGSSSSSSSAAAVTSGYGSAAAASANSSGRISGGGRTIRITELGLELVDRDGGLLWAYDGSRCLNKENLILFGIPSHRSAEVCAAEQLAKAVEKDYKAHRHGR